jgi:hypothetical protein
MSISRLVAVAIRRRKGHTGLKTASFVSKLAPVGTISCCSDPLATSHDIADAQIDISGVLWCVRKLRQD